MYRILKERGLYVFLYVAFGTLAACTTGESYTYSNCRALVWERGATVTVKCDGESETPSGAERETNPPAPEVQQGNER